MDRVHHEGDISDFNLSKMLNRLERLEDYHFPPEKDRMRAIKKYWAGEKVEEVEETQEEIKNEGEVLNGFLKLKVKIVPVLEDISALAGKRKFSGIFDRVVIGGASSVSNLEAITKLGKENCVFTIEKIR